MGAGAVLFHAPALLRRFLTCLPVFFRFWFKSCHIQEGAASYGCRIPKSKGRLEPSRALEEWGEEQAALLRW